MPPTPLHPPAQRKISKVETKIFAIWGILEANLKKCSTLKFMTNISFVPSICIHRSIILIFIEKKVCLLMLSHRKYIFLQISIFIFARILVSATNSRLCYNDHSGRKPSIWASSTVTIMLQDSKTWDCETLTLLNHARVTVPHPPLLPGKLWHWPIWAFPSLAIQQLFEESHAWLWQPQCKADWSCLSSPSPTPTPHIALPVLDH